MDVYLPKKSCKMDLMKFLARFGSSMARRAAWNSGWRRSNLWFHFLPDCLARYRLFKFLERPRARFSVLAACTSQAMFVLPLRWVSGGPQLEVYQHLALSKVYILQSATVNNENGEDLELLDSLQHGPIARLATRYSTDSATHVEIAKTRLKIGIHWWHLISDTASIGPIFDLCTEFNKKNLNNTQVIQVQS